VDQGWGGALLVSLCMLIGLLAILLKL